MKKVIIFLFAISLFACDSNDDSNYQTPNYYAGRWVIAKDGVLNSYNQIDYTEHTNDIDCMEGTTKINIDSFVFNSDNTFVLTDYPYGTCGNPDVVTGNYSVSNGVMTLTYVDENTGETYETSLNVIKFDQNALVLSFPSNTLLGNFGILSLVKQ